MLDITAIILTYNEALHIERCLRNISSVAKTVYVIDCFSSDDTVDIAQRNGAIVLSHEWPGNQASQFNWAIAHLDIKTQWVLRLDADEYLTQELITELEVVLPDCPETVSAFSIPLGRAFCGRILKHGIVNSVKIVRLFRAGMAHYEQRLMDEHLTVVKGEVSTLHNQFIDDSRISIKAFIDKHNNYSSREAALLLDAEYHLTDSDKLDGTLSEAVGKKRAQKEKYAKMPLFWRALFYFFYRYIIKLGFLDGKEGFLWDFQQGLWYRMLIDMKVYEVKKFCGNDKTKIKSYLKDNYNIRL